MASHRGGVAGAIGLILALASAGCGLQGATAAPAAHHGGRCSAGAHTLSAPGSHVYPETGNGGYRSLHTGVYLVYDAASNRFLPGSHVTLADRATQCLTSFSLDFERRSVNASAGPDLAVTSVTVNGRRAAFRFVQPTRALTQVQRRYGDGAITEAQLEAGFRQWLPARSAACGSRLGEFFRQWFDIAYPPGGGANRPDITGPGLAGPGFYTGGCTR